MVTVLITGGTGLIGKALTKALLAKGYNVIILTRYPEKQKISASGLSYAKWDIKDKTMEEEAISTVDYIIHLAGVSIAEKRWTIKRKQDIANSRVESGKLIVDSLKKISNKVKAVISSSAIGWYGPDNLSHQMAFKEADPPAKDFLGQTCKAWEESIEPVTLPGKRLVKLRTGIVLSNDGGALKEFKRPLRFGIATILGNGKQVISWIHIDDLVRMFIAAIENEKLSGVYNAVTPYPVSNKELIIKLAKATKRKYFIQVRVPSFVLKLVLGELSIEVLKSATVSCEKIQKTGFTFQYPDIEKALTQLIY